MANLLNDGRSARFMVRPVVVFPGWNVEQIGSRSRTDVWVLNPKALDGVLAQEPHVLSPGLIDAASHALARYCRRPIVRRSEQSG